jgi:2-keto-3-deoxy-L-rhamnonate aldolase RhmA
MENSSVSPLIRTQRQAAELKRKWIEGVEPSLLGWLSMQDPAVAEIEVEWGYDALIIDTEHSTYEPSSLRVALMAFRGTPCVPIVRVGANDVYQIKTALDLGAGGVLVPLVETARDARAAVAACRYPPEGRRGVSPRRASNYFRDTRSYTENANDSVLVMAQIECLEAYQNLDDILQVEGLTCLFVGPSDLSATMGYASDAGHPDVVHTIEDIIQRGRAAGLPVAIATPSRAEAIQRWLDAGANVVTAGGDRAFMEAGFSAFRDELRGAGIPFGSRSS